MIPRGASLLALFGAIAFAGAAAEPEPRRTPLLVPGPLSARPARYRIDAELEPGARQIAGSVEVAIRNSSSRELRQARLHLYLNAFASRDTLFLRESRGWIRGSHWDPADPGWIRVGEVEQGADRVRAKPIEDGTVLEVELARPVAPGAELSLRLPFRARLPRVFARTGHDGAGLFLIAQWYPKPGVIQPDGSWHCPPFHPRAEFFASFATYDLTLRLPETYVVGATGVEISRRTIRGARQELRLRAEDVHDFAIVAAPSFSVTIDRAGGGAAELRLLAPPGRGSERVLGIAREGLGLLERWLGPYPYRQLTIVDLPTRALGGAAMEYPTLITVWTPAWAPRGVRFFDETTLHELVHQYFQGMVASNEVLEPWLDEGVTSYLTLLLSEEIFGRAGSYLSLGPLALDARTKEQARIVGGRVFPVGWPSRRFPDPGAYGSTVYARAALMLATVESLIGRERMIATLGDYARRFRFRHPRGADLEAALISAAPPATRPTVERLLDGVLRRGEPVDYRLRCEVDRVIVERRGPIALPLELEVELADGSPRRIALDERTSHRSIEIRGLRRAALGPRGRLLLDATPLDNACQPGSGARVAALGIARLLQRLLPLLGP